MTLPWRAPGTARGDRAFLARRAAFRRIGGFPPLELMEDIALSRSLKRVSRPLCLADKAVTSGPRWERRGVLRTVLLMAWLRPAVFFRAAPAKLAPLHDGERGRHPLPGDGVREGARAGQ